MFLKNLIKQRSILVPSPELILLWAVDFFYISQEDVYCFLNKTRFNSMPDVDGNLMGI